MSGVNALLGMILGLVAATVFVLVLAAVSGAVEAVRDFVRPLRAKGLSWSGVVRLLVVGWRESH
jgi:hypothetical protein